MAGVLQQYNGDSLYLAAFVVCLGILLYTGRNQAACIGKKAAVAALLAILCVFNELAYRIVGKITDAATYYRFFWMLPVLFLIAYQLTAGLTSQQKKKVLVSLAAFVLCLGVGANCFINRTNLSRPKNIYGLAPDTITIADAIMADWGMEYGTETDDTHKPVAAFDMYLEYQIRTYEPHICWGISRKAYLYQAKNGYDYESGKYIRQQHIIAAVNEGIQEDSQLLRRCLDKTGVNYLVIRTEFDMDAYLSEISVLPVIQSENYTLYKVW